MIRKETILHVLELGLKPDGTFYSNEEKADMLESYIKDNSDLYRQGWNDGYLECQKNMIKSLD